MKKLMALLVLILAFGVTPAQSNENNPAVQTLLWFLTGASYNDPSVHRQFWAEELTYTSGRGLRYGYDAIMESIADEERLSAEEVRIWYTAEDVQVHHLDNAAIVNFTLVAKDAESEELTKFFNTAVMTPDGDTWKAINWNVTIAAESR